MFVCEIFHYGFENITQGMLGNSYLYMETMCMILSFEFSSVLIKATMKANKIALLRSYVASSFNQSIVFYCNLHCVKFVQSTRLIKVPYALFLQT